MSDHIGMKFGQAASKTFTQFKLDKFTADDAERARIVNGARNTLREGRAK